MNDRPLEPAFANEDPEGWCEIAVWEAERADAAEKRIAELEREVRVKEHGIVQYENRCAELERERDRALDLLNVCGVTRERCGGNVERGIEVYATRMGREVGVLNAVLGVTKRERDEARRLLSVMWEARLDGRDLSGDEEDDIARCLETRS